MATTRLRLVALPFAASGLLLLGEARMPDVPISEDGRLVGVPTGSGKLAVNRARPADFITDSWMRAVAAEELALPARVAGKATAATAVADAAVPVGTVALSGGERNPVFQEAFACDDGLCSIENQSGAVIAHAANAATAKRACAVAVLIVIDDATARDTCAGTEAAVITKRDLARFGSVAVYLPVQGEGAGGPIEIERAIATPYRPWHAGIVRGRHR